MSRLHHKFICFFEQQSLLSPCVTSFIHKYRGTGVELTLQLL